MTKPFAFLESFDFNLHCNDVLKSWHFAATNILFYFDRGKQSCKLCLNQINNSKGIMAEKVWTNTNISFSLPIK